LRILAISDIHGCLNTFKALLQQIKFTKADHLFLIGDFVDRGPDSKGVIDHIWALQAEGYQVTCLKGNHEEMFLTGLKDSQAAKRWLIHGGSQTLDSFDTKDIQSVPQKYLQWMENLPLFIEHEQYIFVHGGLNFKVANPLEAKQSMLWIRNWYSDINYDWLKDRIIVHGHTPTSKSEIELMLDKLEYMQYLDIDAGCVFEYRGLGNLCAVDLTNRKLYFK